MRAQCSYSDALSSLHARYEVRILGVVRNLFAFEKRRGLVENRSIASDVDVVQGRERQPQQVVAESRAHAGAGRRMPPVLHIPFDKLSGGAQQCCLRNSCGAPTASAIESCN